MGDRAIPKQQLTMKLRAQISPAATLPVHPPWDTEAPPLETQNHRAPPALKERSCRSEENQVGSPILASLNFFLKYRRWLRKKDEILEQKWRPPSAGNGEELLLIETPTDLDGENPD